MTLVADLVGRVQAGGEDAHEAALALGLLIERVHRPADDDGGIVAILGADLAAQNPSEAELAAAVEQLIAYVAETRNPHPMAVWALTKSHDPRAAEPLAGLLAYTLANAGHEHEHVAYQALVGLANLGDDRFLELIRQAAREGNGEIRETARGYLRARGEPG